MISRHKEISTEIPALFGTRQPALKNPKQRSHDPEQHQQCHDDRDDADDCFAVALHR